jgi:outer membrane protein TolC
MGDGFLTLRGGLTFLFGRPAQNDGPSEQVPIASSDTSYYDTSINDTSVSQPVVHYAQLNEEALKETIKEPLTLDDCIHIALGRNIPLQLAKGELEKAEAIYAGSSGKFYPVFTLDGSFENTLERRPLDPADPSAPLNHSFDNRAIVGGIQQYLPTGATFQIISDLRRDINSPDRFGEAPTRTRNQAYSFRITQPILRGASPKIARSSINLAEYEWQIQDWQLANAKLRTMFAVKSAFYNALLERELIEVHRAAIQRDSTLVKAAESRVQAKLATRLDILSAEIRLARDRAALIKGQTDHQVALDLLKEVMGLPLGTPITLRQIELGFSPILLDEEELIRSAMQNNPAIKSAEIAVPRSKLELTVTRNALLPQLDLIGEYVGRLDVNTDQNKNLSENGWQAGFSLSYPFFNREAAANVKNAEIALSQEQERLVNLQRQIELGIREIVRRIYSSAEEINAINRSMEAAEEKLDFAMTMYNLGRASNLDITDAQEALVEAEEQYLRQLLEYHTQLALLESLTGHQVAP